MPQQYSRKAFTQERYDNSTSYFCAVPAEWGHPPFMLATLYRAGGLGAIASYPVLGQYTHTSFASEVRLSKQELARLTGRDVRTITRGTDGLAKLGLIARGRAWYRRLPVTEWDIRLGMAASRINGRLDDNYFYFPSRFLHGGNWAKLSAVQQAVFLAVATNSSTLRERPEMSNWLRDRLAFGTSLFDLEACFEYNRTTMSRGGPSDPFIRVAELSYSQLTNITGLSQSAVKAAVSELKHPDIWPEAQNNPATLRYSPLTVYRPDWGPLIYHIRDHAPHWPWDELNRRSQRPIVVQAGPGERWEEDDFPF